jgi:hypothetical protein
LDFEKLMNPSLQTEGELIIFSFDYITFRQFLSIRKNQQQTSAPILHAEIIDASVGLYLVALAISNRA